jgi:hypothetical protein
MAVSLVRPIAKSWFLPWAILREWRGLTTSWLSRRQQLRKPLPNPQGSPRSRAEFLEFSEAIKKGHAVMAGLAAEGFQDNTPAVIWVGGSSSSPIEDDAREV